MKAEPVWQVVRATAVPPFRVRLEYLFRDGRRFWVNLDRELDTAEQRIRIGRALLVGRVGPRTGTREPVTDAAVIEQPGPP